MFHLVNVPLHTTFTDHLARDTFSLFGYNWGKKVVLIRKSKMGCRLLLFNYIA